MTSGGGICLIPETNTTFDELDAYGFKGALDGGEIGGSNARSAFRSFRPSDGRKADFGVTRKLLGAYPKHGARTSNLRSSEHFRIA